MTLDAFRTDLDERVDRYFHGARHPRHGGWLGIGSTVFLVGSMVCLHALALSNTVHGLGFFAVQLALGVCGYLFAVAVAHEATHGSLSGRPWFDRLVLRSFDWVVLSSFVWKVDHVEGHHAHLNVIGRDGAVEGGALLRFDRRLPHRWWHRYQHGYAWVLYACASLHRWLLHDWVRLRHLLNRAAPVRMPMLERMWFGLGIVVKNALYLGLPLWLTDVPPVQLIAGWLAMHVLISVPLVVSVQLSHLFETTGMTRAGEVPVVAVEVTGDFSTTSWWWTLFTGGHNLHTLHHLYSDVHHRHLPALRCILEECARDHGISLTSWPTPWHALRAHHRFLRQLGADPAPAGVGYSGASR